MAEIDKIGDEINQLEAKGTVQKEKSIKPGTGSLRKSTCLTTPSLTKTQRDRIHVNKIRNEKWYKTAETEETQKISLDLTTNDITGNEIVAVT